MKILFNQQQIQAAVNKIAAEIYKKHYNDPNPPVMVCVLNGAFMFFTDLVKHINIDCEIDFIRAKSYTDKEQTEVVIKKDIETDLTNKTVYIVDDIIDSGNTVTKITELFKDRGAKEIKLVALFKRQTSEIECISGIELVNEIWICGYGLDSTNGLLRNRSVVFGDTIEID
jgi:hypoxanthine phosphoribosyltransferase